MELSLGERRRETGGEVCFQGRRGLCLSDVFSFRLYVASVTVLTQRGSEPRSTGFASAAAATELPAQGCPFSDDRRCRGTLAPDDPFGLSASCEAQAKKPTPLITETLHNHLTLASKVSVSLAEESRSLPCKFSWWLFRDIRKDMLGPCCSSVCCIVQTSL